MANIDNPNGFTFVKSLVGFIHIEQATLGADLKAGDAVHMESGVLQLAAGTDTGIYGIMAADGTSGDTNGKFYPALPWYVFEVQTISTTPFVAATHTNYACDLLGGTGVMELDLNDSNQDQFVVLKLADSRSLITPNVVGANANVYCVVFQSQFLGMPGTATVHA
jgi:hypothetical protein